MRRIGAVREVAARELVLALRAGLHALEPARDGVFDGLVVAELEMQERVVLDRAPIASVERLGADEIDGAGDPPPRAAGHDKQDALAHGLAGKGEELAGEIWAAPFA